MSEEWRPIPGYPFYAVSERGAIWSCYYRKSVTPTRMDRGHLRIATARNGMRRYLWVHRAVALAFIGAPPTPQHQIAHFDGNPANNHYSNLRWATVQENKDDSVRHGTVARRERHGSARLSPADVEAIRTGYRRFGKNMKRGNAAELAAQFNVSKSTVRDIVAGLTWAS